jgi:MFS family permease
MFVLMCIVIAEGFASSMVLPFIAFMVMDFGISEDQVGYLVQIYRIDLAYKCIYYAGFITSSFFGAQLISSFFWGYMSDVKGRRIVLLIGLLGNVLSAIAFGFSKWLVSVK